MEQEWRDDAEEQKGAGRKLYVAPALKDYGSVRELTQAGWGTKAEAMSQSKNKRP
ncbi:MAG: lasso RiPP family leader peptide-containing protein [Terriglobales bacterium]